jgi:hypothetical protein
MGETQSETLGQALRRARQERGLTIPQVAATTRIQARHLEALERNDIHAVPGGFYLRADVRAYADAVGLNRNVALALLQAAIDPPVVAEAPPAVTVAPASHHGRRWAAVIGGICLVLATIVMWPPNREARPTVQTNDVPPASPLNTAQAGTPSGTTGSASVLDSPIDVSVDDHPPSPTAADTELDIVSEPADARVTIDGVGWGVTPVTIRYLPPGTKRLRVTKDGYAAEDRLIRVLPDKPQTSVRIELHETQ